MVPAAVCASFAFMLPIAGPSNAIVFSTGRISILDMVRDYLLLMLGLCCLDKREVKGLLSVTGTTDTGQSQKKA